MNEFDSCVHRIIKQIYPVLAYEYEMGLSESRAESSGIYSFQFLSSLHENSMENLHKIVRQNESDRREFDKTDKKILLEFFNYLNGKKSKLAKHWLVLQHYMHYMYRTLTSPNPQIYNREISEFFIEEMKNLVRMMAHADEIQLYLRIFSILREYVTFAYWQYTKQTNQEPAIDRLYKCYQSFLIASKNIYPVFMDLEKLLKEKCNMTWMDYNKFLFFNYFYHAIDEEILQRIERSVDVIDVPDEYNAMVIDFGELNTLWQTLKNLRGINENMDKEMSEDHRQILQKNFWICRMKAEEKQSVQRLAAELIILASERRIRAAEPLLDKNGQCSCEDCLIFRLSCIVASGEPPNPAFIRVSPCRYCPEFVEINTLHDHTVDHLKEIVAHGNVKAALPNYKIPDVGNGKMANEMKGDKNSEKKMSQCLISLLKKNRKSIRKTDYTDQKNRSNDKKVEHTNMNETKEEPRVPAIKSETTNKNSSACSHSCKHEEELKAELKKLQGVCDHHKESKRCDCTYCEVFGSTGHVHKTSETRNRLRIRLNQRKQKMVSKSSLVDKTNKAPAAPIQFKTNLAQLGPNLQVDRVETIRIVRSATEKPPASKSPNPVERDLKITSETLKPKIAPKTNDTTGSLNDIHGLVDFIEGNAGSDKAAIAEKKAAKKARQRQKKEEERKQIEEDEKRKEEEKKREEEAKMKLLKQLEKERNLANEGNKKNTKKQKGKEKPSLTKSEKTKLIEETIPAMVTIKRGVENGDTRSTVTITLKGSTPDQDELLYTLVNGHTDQTEKDNNASGKSKKNKKQTKSVEQKAEHLVKLQVLQKDSGKDTGETNKAPEKEVKVSFTVNNGGNHNINVKNDEKGSKKTKQENKRNSELDLPFLRLPPGITITKVDGPLSNKNYKVTVNGADNSGSNVPVNNKSGVIVVDTEKLIHTNGGGKESGSSKKNKKKKNKKPSSSGTSNISNSKPSMVTLKNPVFQTMNSSAPRESPLPVDIAAGSCGQASIFKNENGMVTIRSSRLQQSLSNGVPMHNLLTDLKPVMGNDVGTPPSNSCSSSENTMSSFNAQEILSGLPGIEITKVDKKNPKPDNDSKACQVAQVSIIPTNGEKCSIDKDDWIYDNIFTPKDVLEDDLDAEERELEAFKRFCQQSIPPKQKEKVAHLNVKDIVFKKKDFNYF